MGVARPPSIRPTARYRGLRSDSSPRPRVGSVTHRGASQRAMIAPVGRSFSRRWCRQLRGRVPIDAGGPVDSPAIGDVNHDGHPDLVPVNDDHTMSVVVNRGACRETRRLAAGTDVARRKKVSSRAVLPGISSIRTLPSPRFRSRPDMPLQEALRSHSRGICSSEMRRHA
jgi:hypothetical protein